MITKRLGINSGKSKIKNVTKCEYKGIKFRSKIELFCYKEIEKLGIDPGYERAKVILQYKFIPKTFVFEPNKLGNIEANSGMVRDLTYTPDFYFPYNGCWVVIETKGFARETYNIKRKLFLNSLQESKSQTWFFEPHNQKQVLQCIEIIKNI